MKKTWKDLTKGQKGLVLGLSLTDLIAKATALRVLYKTPQKAIRGPKWLWAIIIVVVNSFGPASFFAVGRK